MKSKSHHYLAIILLLIVSCSNQQTGEFSTPQQVSPTVAVILPASTTTIPSTPTITATSIVTFTLSPTETHTPTPIDLSNLPKLTNVILSSEDIESVDEFGSNPLVTTADTTKELGGACLWDCAKYLYSLEHGTLTIVLLRAGSQQKAESTSESLRNDFLKTAGVEYTINDISSMPEKAWSIVDEASSTKDFRTSAAGIAHGEIVVLVTYSQNFCEYMPNYGRFCEGDIMGLAMNSIAYLNLQIKKLQIAGYQK